MCILSLSTNTAVCDFKKATVEPPKVKCFFQTQTGTIITFLFISGNVLINLKTSCNGSLNSSKHIKHIKTNKHIKTKVMYGKFANPPIHGFYFLNL